MEPTTPLPDYRWSPSGKVVFVAPSKPPVAQQIEACNQTCGIPGSDAVELTGEASSKKPIEVVSLGILVSYMDLMLPCTVGGDTGVVIGEHLICRPDPQRKHRRSALCKGDYAYAQIIRESTHKNPHFRVLALTATPGGKPEDLQELCDVLHISHIDIWDEFSPDLKQYVFNKLRSPMEFAPRRFIDLSASRCAGNRTRHCGNER